ncbi:hypothetical protein CTI12_AA182970 [Artemisia annua]|uniref:Uncharacterized protein n=1 Tax=Artemisia annua TaxID=35608 RepID=A0A2U1P7Q0_ARTAN|nr:hypothetical protein CTI12_AA182970 [Artemisia annua]
MFDCSSTLPSLYHRQQGLHVLECVIDVAFAVVKREQLEEVSNIYSFVIPQLQPLVVVMGCDLLPGKTDIRRKLLQLLWTSKSRILKMDSFYGNKSDDLDLNSFVACVNSRQSWSVKSSLLFSGKANTELENNDSQLDQFIENLVLEWLSVHNPFETWVKVSLEAVADKPPRVQVAAAQEVEVHNKTFLLDIMELNIVTLQLTLKICCRGGCFDLFIRCSLIIRKAKNIWKNEERKDGGPP